MKIASRLLPRKMLSFLFVTVAFVVTAAAAVPTADQLLGDLQKSIGGRDAAADPRIGQLLTTVKGTLAQGRLAEAEQYLANIRPTLAANEKAVTLLDQLVAAIQAQAAEALAKREAVLESIVNDTSAKVAAHAPPADFDALLKRLANLPTARDQYNDATAQKIEAARSFVTRYQDYLLQTAAGNSDQAVNTLNELIQLSSRLPIIPRSELVTMQTEAAKRPSVNNDAAQARLEALRKRVTEAIDTAAGASDFDAVLVELAKPVMNDPYRNNSSYNNNISNQHEVLRRFAHRWQDYYSQLEAGNGTNAQNVLRELSNDSSTEAFYPRSKILARLNGKTVGAAPITASSAALEPLIAPDALTLENLDQFGRQVAARRYPGSSGTTDPSVEEIASALSSLRSAANQLKAGNPQPAVALLKAQTTYSSGAGSGAYTLALVRLQQALVLKALPSYLSAPADLVPTGEEAVAGYLQRVIRQGRDKKDWQLVYRTLGAAQNFLAPGGGTSPVTSDIEGYKQFFTGLNEERAGQWTAAARSFFGALRTDGPNLPAEEIGVHLKALKEGHPKEFEVAELQPYPVNLSYPPGFYPGRISPNPAMSGSVIPAQQSAGSRGAAARPPANPLGAPPPESAAPAPAASKP